MHWFTVAAKKPMLHGRFFDFFANHPQNELFDF
jgi:hypothetical protein